MSYAVKRTNSTFHLLCTLSKNSKDSIYHVNGLFDFKYNIIPLIFLGMLGRRIVVSPRGMLDSSALLKNNELKRFIIFLYRNIKKIIWHVSSFKEYADVSKHIKQGIIHEIPELIIRSSSIKNHHFPREKGYAIHVGRIHKVKNQIATVLQYHKIKSMFSSLYILGPIEDQAYLNEVINLIKELKIEEQVVFLGECDPEETRRYIANASLSFQISEFESFGHVIAESIMNNTPVIISKNTPWGDLAKYSIGIVLEDPMNELDNNQVQKLIDSDKSLFVQYIDQSELLKNPKGKYINLYKNHAGIN